MMNSQTTKDITGFRSYFPDVLRLIFEEQLSVRAIALEQLGLSHSTVHNIEPPRKSWRLNSLRKR